MTNIRDANSFVQDASGFVQVLFIQWANGHRQVIKLLSTRLGI